MRSTSLFTLKRIGLRMSTTLSSEDICLYEYMESIGGRNFEMQARTVKWGGQKCCCDHKIWLVGEKKNIVGHVPQNISKTCSMFLKVPNISIEVQILGKRLNHGGGPSLPSVHGKFLNAWNKYLENRSVLSFFLLQFLKMLNCPLIAEKKRPNLLFCTESDVR